MKAFLWLVVGLLMIGCASETKTTQAGGKELRRVKDQPEYALAEPISYRNVTVIPVVSTKKIDQDVDYASLEEAKKNGWVEIIEKPGDEEVNSLRVRNLGPKPILLLAGQLLIGGKQDRIVGKDTVVPVGETIEVPVYCVEHGRWQGDTHKFEYQNQVVPKKVKDAAMFGRQEEVWSRVGEVNEEAKADSSTSTVMAGLEAPEVRAKIDEGYADLAEKLRGIDGCVGVIYAVNGRIETLELFGGESLWKSSMEGIVRGIVATGATVTAGKSESVSLDDAEAFLTKVLTSERSLAARNGGQAARASNDPRLLSVDSDGVKGQEMLMEAPAASAKPADRQVLHGTYNNSDSK